MYPPYGLVIYFKIKLLGKSEVVFAEKELMINNIEIGMIICIRLVEPQPFRPSKLDLKPLGLYYMLGFVRLSTIIYPFPKKRRALSP